mmetsp:Transcript_21937/g.51862  ORF Transcript_21937/g.51862 Transcript_21937/m.51862 type:complete len:287 (+) Transcript_21937:81-941(+)
MYLDIAAGFDMHSVIADMTRGFDCASCINCITSGFFIISCALPMASPMPPMPPIPPGIPPENGFAPPKGVDPPAPPKGLAPPAGPPPMPMFFNMSPMFPISIPPIPPGMPPGMPPPPKGLAPAPPAPGPPAPSLDFFLGPDRSSVNTSTSAALYSAYPSSFTEPPPAADVFFTPSTRASAKALTNSDFSKKLLVETPSDCNSVFSSDAFMLWHFSISSARRFSRSAPVGGDGSGSADSDRTFFFFFLPLAPSVDVEVAKGVLPSARALVSASTSSDFSKKLLVERP